MLGKWLLPILILLAIFVFSNQGLKGGPEITVLELKQLLKSQPQPVIIDLREPALFNQGHIESARSVPAQQLKEKLSLLGLPKMEPIILYSDDEARTREATRLLYDQGYGGALSLKGGIAAWKATMDNR